MKLLCGSKRGAAKGGGLWFVGVTLEVVQSIAHHADNTPLESTNEVALSFLSKP